MQRDEGLLFELLGQALLSYAQHVRECQKHRPAAASEPSANQNGDITYLTAAEVARLVGLSVERVYELAHQQTIPAIRIGRWWRFDKAAVLDAMRTGQLALDNGKRK